MEAIRPPERGPAIPQAPEGDPFTDTGEKPSSGAEDQPFTGPGGRLAAGPGGPENQ